ncbi:CLUMA_CG005659, isoform A [Clunio marinus]|uniref:CLUMA_CG005659, isoform A n=1 Tax=Clunio marinus TaxID=568069 RepID=A0A1J1HVQ7_9DIPT|nr:CLUMA_CG005659, isoform A [Clunio marinus]
MNWNKRILNIVVIISFLLGVESLKFDDEAAPSQQTVANLSSPPSQINVEGRQSARHLFDFVGLGTGEQVDPFLRKTNEKCLNGELAECFKSQALNSFDELFKRDVYVLTPHVRVLRMPETQLRSLAHEPYEFSNEARQISESYEWNDLIQFALRRAERFLKSNVIELKIPEEYTEGGRYSPRFVDEISDELDVIEDKHAPLFSKSLFTKHKIKKMFIPMLIILKLFKLKLLLFLPFILGLTGLKKILGLAALVIPGIIGYFKLCRPTSGFNNHIYSEGHIPQYSSAGLGGASYNPLYSKYSTNPYRQDPSFSAPYNNYYRDASTQNVEGGVRFGDDAQDLAYRNSKVTA